MPTGPNKLQEDHNFKIQIDGNNSQHSVDGSYNLDLVRQDGTRQKVYNKRKLAIMDTINQQGWYIRWFLDNIRINIDAEALDKIRYR